MSKDLIQALEEALSVCQSVNMGKHHRVMRDGCAHYLQTEEWCKWAEEEVAPALREALSRHRSSVESVELPEGEAFALGTGLLWPGDAPPEGEDGCEALYTASTVRSLIAAAVEREREECAKVCDMRGRAIEAARAHAEGSLFGANPHYFTPLISGISSCAAAIRSRGEMK